MFNFFFPIYGIRSASWIYSQQIHKFLCEYVIDKLQHFNPIWNEIQLNKSSRLTGWEPLPASTSSYCVCLEVCTHTCRLKTKKWDRWRFSAHTWHHQRAPYSLCPLPWWLGRWAGEGVWFLWAYGGGHSPGLWAPARSHPWLQRASSHAVYSTTETSCTVQERQSINWPIRQKPSGVQLSLAAEATWVSGLPHNPVFKDVMYFNAKQSMWLAQCHLHKMSLLAIFSLFLNHFIIHCLFTC